jgi:hypothetical protein
MRAIAGLMLAALLTAVTGCATQGGVGSGKSNVRGAPEVRAQERWDHLIGGKPELAYTYLTPGARSTKPLEAYAADMKSRPVHWLSAKALGKECKSEDSCTVRVYVEYSAKLPLQVGGNVTAPAELEEQWIAVDGVWYYAPADLVQGKGLR